MMHSVHAATNQARGRHAGRHAHLERALRRADAAARECRWGIRSTPRQITNQGVRTRRLGRWQPEKEQRKLCALLPLPPAATRPRPACLPVLRLVLAALSPACDPIVVTHSCSSAVASSLLPNLQLTWCSGEGRAARRVSAPWHQSRFCLT
jgi:hypothetical protein